LLLSIANNGILKNGFQQNMPNVNFGFIGKFAYIKFGENSTGLEWRMDITIFGKDD